MGRYMHNVRMLTYFAPFKTMSVSAAYLTPFFLEKGLNLSGIFWLQTVYALLLVGWEIPSGIIADRFGRARCIKLSVPVAAVALAIYAISDTYWLFIVCEALLAVASGLLSGVDEALVRDSLRAEGYNGEQLDQEQVAVGQRIDTMTYLSIGVSVFLAMGLVAWVNVSATLMADAVLTAAGGVFAFRLIEAPRFNGGQKAARLSSWRAVAALGYNPEARWLLVLVSILATGTYTGFWLSAPYYSSLGVPTALFGGLLAVRSFVKAGLSHRFTRQRHLQRNMLAYAMLVGLVFAVMATRQLWLLPAVLGLDVVQALHKRPVVAKLNGYMHQDRLATMNSVVNLMQRLTSAVMGPIAGSVTDHFGLSAGLAVTGGVCCAVALLAIWRLYGYGTFAASAQE